MSGVKSLSFDSPSNKNITRNEWLETFESNFSHLSPRTREASKLEKEIKKNFETYGKAPEVNARYYRIGKILGKGAFGKVNLAIHRLAHALVAMKSINKQCLVEEY